MKWQDISVDIKILSPANELLLDKVRLQGDFLKLATYDWSDERFLLTSKFCLQGVVSPHEKNCIKSYKEFFFFFFFKLVANDLSDKRFLLTSKFCPLVPWGCLPLICGCTHLLNHEKMCIKSEVEEILFKLATNDHSDEPSCWHKIFGPNGLCAPYSKALFKLLFLNNRWV